MNEVLSATVIVLLTLGVVLYVWLMLRVGKAVQQRLATKMPGTPRQRFRVGWIVAEVEVAIVFLALAAVSDKAVATLAMGGGVMIIISLTGLILWRTWLKQYP